MPSPKRMRRSIRNGKEMRPVLNLASLDEAQEGFVDESGRLRRAVRSFVPKVALRQAPQLLVHDWRELIDDDLDESDILMVDGMF